MIKFEERNKNASLKIEIVDVRFCAKVERSFFLQIFVTKQESGAKFFDVENRTKWHMGFILVLNNFFRDKIFLDVGNKRTTR